MFYVYEWYVVETGEVIYVGKGTRNRYRVRKHNRFFNDFIRRVRCESRIVQTYETEKEAFEGEHKRICELKAMGQCVCNIRDGGCGGTTSWWTGDRRKEYSERNVMKSKAQRERMSKQNPMKDKEVAKRVGLKHGKPVLVDGKMFDTVRKAAEYIGTSDIYLTSCLRHRGGVCKGHTCEYGNQQPSRGKADNSTSDGSTTNG